MSKTFVLVDRETPYLLPPSLEEWLPADHLARFVVEIVEELDISRIESSYSGGGSPAYHPRMLVSLLFYSYATGTFSSRRIEAASHDSLATRYICANQHPDHDTIASFRKRFLTELPGLFVQILCVAQQMGLLKLGNVSIDGTKLHANASKHKALSWEHAAKLERQLEAEVATLMQRAEQAEQSENAEQINVPEELARRQNRLAAIRAAKLAIAERVRQRDEQQQAEYQQKLDKRANQERSSGRKPRGNPPKPPESGPKPNDQINLTDEQSRIMPLSGGGFEQSYNAQALVDVTTHLIVAQHVTQASNDKEQIQWALDEITALPTQLGTVTAMLGDNGYLSEQNVTAIEAAAITPLIALGRQAHNLPLEQRLQQSSQPAEAPPGEEATAMTRMAYRLKTVEGSALYAKRKSTVEPVFGIIKHVLGFRQFLLRGYQAVIGEWALVSMAWNLKRMKTLRMRMI